MKPPNTDDRILKYLKKCKVATSEEVASATDTSFKWARRRLKKLAAEGVLIEHPSLISLQETYTIAENSAVPFTSFCSLDGGIKPYSRKFPPPLTEIGASIHALREQKATV